MSPSRAGRQYGLRGPRKVVEFVGVCTIAVDSVTPGAHGQAPSATRYTELMNEQPQNPWLAERAAGRILPGDDYDATYERRAAAGENVHGEADLVERLGVRSVLDAGCGTGRIARELARRGIAIAGVDLDAEMLAVARRKAPELDWRQGDLETIKLRRTFDAVLMAGNVVIYLTPGTEPAVLKNLAAHLNLGGYLIAGFQQRPGKLTFDDYDKLAEAAGLDPFERWATWDQQLWHAGDSYAVCIHQKQRE